MEIQQVDGMGNIWNKFDAKLTPRQKSIRALEIFRVQKLILNATS